MKTNRHLRKLLSLLCAITVVLSAFYLPINFSAEAAVIPVTDDETIVFGFEKEEDPVVIHDQDKNFTRGNDGVGVTGWSMNVFSADGADGIGRVRAVGKNHTNPVNWSDFGGYRLNNKNGVYNLEPNSTYVVSLKLRVSSGPKSYTGFTATNTTELSLGYGFLGTLDGVNNPVSEMKTVVCKIFEASTDSNTYTVFNEAGETVYELSDEFNEFTYAFSTPEDLGEGAHSLGFFARCWYGTNFLVDDVSVTKVGSANGVALLVDEFSGTTDILTGKVGDAIELGEKTSQDSNVIFNGWYTDTEGANKVESATFTGGKQVFYANWKAPVTVTFVDALNGTSTDVTGLTGEPIEIPNDPADNVNEPDQKWFMGWYTTEAYTEGWNESTFGQSSYKVYAKWMGVIEDEVEDFENYTAHLDKGTRPGDFDDIVYNNHLYFGNTMDIVDSADGKALLFEFDSSMKKDLTDPDTYEASEKFAVYDNMALIQNVLLLENTTYTVTFDYFVENIADSQNIRIFPVNNGEGNIWGSPIDFRLTQGAYFDITADKTNGEWQKGEITFTMQYSVPTARALYFVIFLGENSDVKLYIDNITCKAVQPYESTVTYVHNNGDSNIIVVGNRGDVIPEYIPQKNGITFGGWYADEALTIPFEQTVFGKTAAVAYAKWSGSLITFDDNYKWYETSELVFGRGMKIVNGDGVGYDDNYKLSFDFVGDKEWGPDMWTGQMTYWHNRVKSVRDHIVRLGHLKNNTAYKISYYYKSALDSNVDVVVNFATNTEGNIWDPDGYVNYDYTKQSIAVKSREWKYAETFLFTDFATDAASMLYLQLQGVAPTDKKGIIAKVDIDNIVITEYSTPYIYFDGQNKSYSEVVSGKIGEEITFPANPLKVGYKFTGWYLDKEATKPFTDTTFKENVGITVYAGYVKSDDVLYDFENFNYEEYPGWFLWDEGCERVKTDITVSGEHALRFDRDLTVTNNGRSGFICVGDDTETFKIDSAKKYIVTFNYYIEKQASKDATITFRSGSENNYWHFVTDVSGKHSISFADEAGVWKKVALVVDGAKMTQTEHVCLYIAMDGGDGGVFYVDDINISTLPDGHNAYVIDNKNCANVPLYVTGAIGSSFLNKLPSNPKMSNYYFGGYSILDENGNVKELSAENAVFTENYAKIIANFVRLETVQNFDGENYKALLGSFGEYTTLDFDYELYDSSLSGNSKENVTSGRYALHRKGETYFFENAQLLTADLPLSNAERYTITMKVKLGKYLQTDGAIKIASCKSLYYPWDTTGDYHAIYAIKDLVDGEWHEISYTFNSVEMYLSLQTPGYCELFIDDVKITRVDKTTDISANVSYTEYVPAKRDANGNLLEKKPTDIDISSIVDASLYIEETNVLPYIVYGGIGLAVVIAAVVLIIVFKKRKSSKI